MSWLLVIGLKNAILVLPLAALAASASRWSRRPALAHLLWAIVLIKLLTPPLFDVPLGWHLDVERWIAGSVQEQGEPGSPATAAASNRRSRSSAIASTRQMPASGARGQLGNAAASHDKPETKASWLAAIKSAGVWLWERATWPRLLVMGWLAGSAVIAMMFVVRLARFRRYLRFATGRDEFLAPRVAELAHLVGLQVAPRVIVVDGIVSPMLWGLGENASLIFPAQLIRRLSSAKLDSLLLHELAHYSRGDHWMRALELTAWILFWWHPVVWWARREIEAAEEECCDGWVVERQQGTRHAYAEALLTTIDFLCERPVIAAPSACGLGEVELLRVRLTQIMKGPAAGQLSRTGWIAVLAAGILISPLEPALMATSTPRLANEPRNRSDEDRTSASVSPKVRDTRPRAKRILTTSIDRAKTRPATPLPIERVVPRAPSLMSRPLPALWATATSPDGRHRLQWRTQRRTVLSGTQGTFRVDLSAHGFRCVSFAPDSATFASGHDDSLVRLWDSETGGLITSLKGSPAPITSVHMAPDGVRIAAGAADGSVMVWEIDSGDVLAQLPPQFAAVSCLRWDLRGDRLAIAVGGFTSGEGAAGLLVWNPAGGAVLAEQALAEPAGALDWADGDTLILASWSGAARLWSIIAGAPIGEYQVDKDQVSAASWSPDCPLRVPTLDDQLLSRIED